MLLPIAFLIAVAQDGPPPLPPPPLPEAAPAAEVLDVDGDPVRPGTLPRSAEPAARAAWERLLALSAALGPDRAPVTGFDLAIDLRLRREENQTNDFKNARYAYLAPKCLLADTGTGRRHLRGPKGDWLVDATAEGARALVHLDVGRENAEDRKQIDDAVDIARLFVGLVDPRSVRVQEFKAAPVPEQLLPESRRAEARNLTWWELRTPDVRPGRDNPVGARILLGLSPAGIPRLAVTDDVRAAARLNPTTSCIDLDDWQRVDDWMMPRKFLVFLPRLVEKEGAGGIRSRVASGWRAEPVMDLHIKHGNLKPALEPEDFLPPTPESLKR